MLCISISQRKRTLVRSSLRTMISIILWLFYSEYIHVTRTLPTSVSLNKFIICLQEPSKHHKCMSNHSFYPQLTILSHDHYVDLSTSYVIAEFYYQQCTNICFSLFLTNVGRLWLFELHTKKISHIFFKPWSLNQKQKKNLHI